MEGSVVSDVEALLRLALALGLGALIGLDREARSKPAGVRTFSIVALGACLFTLVGAMAFGEATRGRASPPPSSPAWASLGRGLSCTAAPT
jgi:putative Mg2+ transporter-C (MgtC) family protein